MTKVVVFDKYTNEIMAIICTDGNCVCRNDIDFQIFGDDAEPILNERNGKMYFVDNAILYKENGL